MLTGADENGTLYSSDCHLSPDDHFVPGGVLSSLNHSLPEYPRSTPPRPAMPSYPSTRVEDLSSIHNGGMLEIKYFCAALFLLCCFATLCVEWKTSALYTVEVCWKLDISVLSCFCLCRFATLCVEWKTSAYSGGTLEIRYFCTVLFLLCCFTTLCVEWKTSVFYTVEVS